MHSQLKQQGFTLYIVLVLMAIIAILVLAGGQTLNTEMRISTNSTDRKYAFGLAEDALKAGERYALENIHSTEVLTNINIQNTLDTLTPQPDVFFQALVGNDKVFKESCENGLCAPYIEQAGGGGTYADDTEEVAWKRADVFDGTFANSIEYALTDTNVARSPRYIIEFLGPSADASHSMYRVTARSWGRSANTEVTLQSVISMNNQIEVNP